MIENRTYLEEQEYYRKLYEHEVRLYGEDIVHWSILQEMEKIKEKLEKKIHVV